MPIWLETVLGLAAIALCAVACWREDQLVITRELKNRVRKRSNTKT